ncbi:TniQ family protein [Marinobacter adhaerens]|uniref:TniQ family protein n=1 Tax=Marinobacter adhaerens TaxID=1033846 RepID=UPI003F6F547B
MKRFAIRPEPFEHESFNCFLLRVGKLNCIFKPAEILDCLGTQSTAASATPGWLEAPSRTTFKALESKLERPLESHRVRIKAREQLQWLRSEDRMISDLRLGFPRICPDCVSEQGYLDWRWGLTITAHCPKHERVLIESCPNCKKQLNWSGSLLIGCSRCDQTWSDIEPSSASEMTETERQIWRELDAELGYLDESRLRDICRAISVAMRPFDLIHESVKHCPSLAGHSEFVRLAYLLLESPEVNASWRKQCHQKRKEVCFLGDDFVEAPCNLFGAHLERKWPGTHPKPQHDTETPVPKHYFTEVTKYISQSRRDRKIEDEGGSGYRYQVTVQSFAAITGMSMENAQDFFKAEALIAHKGVRKSRRRRFDLRQFRRILETASTLNDSIEILPDDKKLGKHLATFGQLAAAVIDGRVRGAFPETGNFEKLYIEGTDFERWLEARLRGRRKKEELTLEQVTQALDRSPQDIHGLIDDGRLKWAKTRSDKTRIDGASFVEHVMRSKTERLS